MPAPLALDDEQLTLIMDGARPLPTDDRDAYLTLVAEELQGLATIGNREVRAAVASAQREVWSPPTFDLRQVPAAAW